jgi:Ser/Thr protein kinase RdoA (MazF antagonist)
MNEIPLTGGRVTEGVVRVGETVRRPRKANAELVRALLLQLDSAGFEAAPRYLGRDDQGREILSFLEGDVPSNLDPALSDEALTAAAHLIRRFHDATAGSEISGDEEVVCHNDLSPCNFVFQAGLPTGLIDFDAAAPGDRLHDLGYALFLWLNLGYDGVGLNEQARRLAVFCRAYGVEPSTAIVDAILGAVAENVEDLRTAPALGLEWWQKQLEWLGEHRDGFI